MQDETQFSIETEEVTLSPLLIDNTMRCITDLYEKYSDDLYMVSKIHHYISQQLPVLLANLEETRQRSAERTHELTVEQERFMSTFLHEHRYFYVPSNEKFFQYDGHHYSETSENHILHHIVTSISRERNVLMNWKHKTKVSTLKKIKDQNITRSIPESETIQRVLQLFYPLVFSSKKEAKYVLTILGDNVMKKHTSLLHFIHPRAKLFLRNLNNASIMYFNTQCVQTFKYKCHEKHYEMDNQDCRIVPLGDSFDKETVWEIMEPHVLDILCVACHYSTRYSCSDDFVRIYNTDELLTHYIFKIYNTGPEKMLDEFAKEYLYVMGEDTTTTVSSSSPMDQYILQCCPQPTGDMSQRLSWMSMFYLWKDYLRIHKYPLNLYQPLCKSILCDKIFPSYFLKDEDMFAGIGSSKMPVIHRFLKFWESTIVDDEENEELEIDEIVVLFRSWLSKKYVNKIEKQNLQEEEILNILRYYYPDLDIEGDKFVYRIRCTLWDKNIDIEAALSVFKEQAREEGQTAVSVYDAYQHYSRFYQTSRHDKLVVGKSYFEKYMTKEYGAYLSESGIIELSGMNSPA